MPLSQLQVWRIFGKFAYREDPNHRGMIIIDPVWKSQNIVYEPIPYPLKDYLGNTVRKVKCHKLAIEPFRRVLEDLYQQGLLNLIEVYCGGWVSRHKMWNPKRSLSSHSFGIAFDTDCHKFPYGSKKKRDQRLIDIFVKYGFENGQKWSPPDAMHWELIKI